jgi:hypothetical protein
MAALLIMLVGENEALRLFPYAARLEGKEDRRQMALGDAEWRVSKRVISS